MKHKAHNMKPETPEALGFTLHDSSFRFRERGAVALISILVVTTVIFTVALSVSILGIGAVDVSRVQGESQRAFGVAEACLDEGMLRLMRDNSWTGDTLSVGDGSCTMTVSGAGPYTINVVATVADATRRVEVDFNTSTNSITRWEEPTSP